MSPSDPGRAVRGSGSGYALFWRLALACSSPYFLARSRKHPKEMRERRGRWGALPAGAAGAYWLHGASMGEMGAALPLLRGLRSCGQAPFVSVMTPAARAREAELCAAGAVAVRFAPLDFPPWVRRAMDRIQPRALLILETEIWPGLLREATQRGVPTAFVSARLSRRGWRRSRRLRRWLRDALRQVHVGAQTRMDADRWIDLGVSAGRLRVTGNTKYHAPQGPLPAERRARLRGAWRRVVVLGSVRTDEIPAVAAAVRAAQNADGRVLYVIAPRHPERASGALRHALGSVLPLIERTVAGDELLPRPQAFTSARAGRTGGESGSDSSFAAGGAILLVSTIGELRRFYEVADIGFVGGTLCPIGGHNLFEAAELGIPVLHGPNVANVVETAEALREHGGGFEFRDGEALGAGLVRLLRDRDAREAAGAGALAAARSLGGAVDRTLLALAEWGFPLKVPQNR